MSAKKEKETKQKGKEHDVGAISQNRLGKVLE